MWVQVWHPEGELLIGTACIPLSGILREPSIRVTSSCKVYNGYPEAHGEMLYHHGTLHVAVTKTTRWEARKRRTAGKVVGLMPLSADGDATPGCIQQCEDDPWLAQEWRGRTKALRLEALPLYAQPMASGKSIEQQMQWLRETQEWRKEEKQGIVASRTYGCVAEHVLHPVHGSLCFF